MTACSQALFFAIIPRAQKTTSHYAAHICRDFQRCCTSSRTLLFEHEKNTAPISAVETNAHTNRLNSRSAFLHLTISSPIRREQTFRVFRAKIHCHISDFKKTCARMENDIPLKILAISTAATLGVLLRLALDNVFSGSNLMITSSTGILFAVLPSNFCGCFILGFHESLKRRFKYPDWLDLAIATGFTGSVTTFASWFLQVTSMLAFGPRFQAFLAILVGIGMAFFGFILGRDGADLLLHIIKKREQVDLSRQEDSAQPSESRGRKAFATVASFVVFAVIYGGMIYGSIRGKKDGSGNNWDFYFMCAVFAPFGALLRWLLSRFNSKIERFPLGTFAANMAAMVVNLSISTALFFSSTPSFSTVFILSAVVSGLGGSLSTVSTWVKEALQLPRSSRYVYVLGTVCAAVVLGVVIFAFPVWVS